MINTPREGKEAGTAGRGRCGRVGEGKPQRVNMQVYNAFGPVTHTLIHNVHGLRDMQPFLVLSQLAYLRCHLPDCLSDYPAGLLTCSSVVLHSATSSSRGMDGIGTRPRKRLDGPAACPCRSAGLVSAFSGAGLCS